MTAVSTLRPGLLVSLKTSIRGNISYQTEEIEGEHRIEGGGTVARWETQRTVANRAELDRAVKARAAARNIITAKCSQTSFGLLCPASAEKSLLEAIAQSRQIAAEFNSRATCTELSVYVIVGRVAQDDAEAIRAINAEVRELMKEMATGIKDLNVKQVRDAAYRARAVGVMLTPEAGERVKNAIEVAREAARKIVKAGETAAAEIDKEAIKKINLARTTFIDLDGEGDARTPIETPRTRGRAVDFAVAPPPRTRVVRRRASQQQEKDEAP